jgi:hypothetical protein
VEGIKDALGRLSELSEAELSDLESQIISEFESVEAQELTQQAVDSMTELADALESVREEQGTRAAKQQELQAKAEEAASRVRVPEAETADMGSDEDEEDTDEVPAEDETTEEEEEEAVPVFSESAAADTSAKSEPAAEAQAEETPSPEPVKEAEMSASDQQEQETVEEPAAPEASASVETAPESEASDNTTPTEITSNEETAVAASAADVTVPSTTNSTPVIESASMSITAGADISGITAGTKFENGTAVTDAFIKRLHSLRRVTGGDGERHVVATIHADYPEDRKLYSGDQNNWEKIKSVTSPQALTASAGCAPLETDYSIFGLGDTDRPVRDALAKFNADRGGIRYYPGPSLPDMPADGTGGLGVWNVDGTVTAADGTTDLAGVKPCFTISCPTIEEVTVDAVSACLTFNNLTSRAFPELVEANTNLLMVQQARVTEQYVLDIMADDTATAVTAVAAPDFTVGSAREFLAQIDLVSGAMRYKHRLKDSTPLRVLAPQWLAAMFRADIAMQAPGDGLEALSVADSMIGDALRRRNINIAWSMESNSGAPTPGTTAFPATVEWDIFPEGTWLYLDGGSMDLGVIRDSTLVGSNDYMEFAEEFMGVAAVGNDSWHVTSTLDVSGVAAALFQSTFS